ncbi:hypothetical protein S40285_10277 [Stachybotrys chlorohalonatus IBT 40285]|uniref:Uncharacterized protein n=1 Tax=Stachybotrys chlorohalonatus (strain IBT 40285) TaxID=1283841 RepID=A0A084Q9R5_STAC4|nr:hypothetical protein S40285_10277 [Stachybotrys chlorohalonata IBT 40285]
MSLIKLFRALLCAAFLGFGAPSAPNAVAIRDPEYESAFADYLHNPMRPFVSVSVDDVEFPSPLAQCYKENRCSYITKWNTCGLGREEFQVVGRDYQDCRKNYAKIICCHDSFIRRIPPGKRCEWRGCTGTGREGDIVLFLSNRGGRPNERGTSIEPCFSSTEKKYKSFTCPLPEWPMMKKTCRWTVWTRFVNEHLCDEDEWEVGELKRDKDWGVMRSLICCKKNDRPPVLLGCHWANDGHCMKNTCPPDEMLLWHGDNGLGWLGCLNGNHLSYCCKPNLGVVYGVCTIGTCERNPRLCPKDPWEEKEETPELDESDPTVKPVGPNITVGKFLLVPKTYPAAVDLHNTVHGKHSMHGKHAMPYAFTMASGACNDSQLVKLDENSLSKAEKRTAYTVDRLIEMDVMIHFLNAAINGTLPTGKGTDLPKISGEVLQELFFGGNHAMMIEALGSNENRRPLILLNKSLNMRKRIIFSHIMKETIDIYSFLVDLDQSDKPTQSGREFLTPIVESVAVWRMLHDPLIQDRVQETRQALLKALLDVSGYLWRTPLKDLPDIFRAAEQAYWDVAADRTRRCLLFRIDLARQMYQQEVPDPISPGHILHTLQSLQNQTYKWVRTYPKLEKDNGT